MRAFHPLRLYVWIGLILLSATCAQAHASLVMSHPAAGALLRQPPVSIRLRFNEPVTPLAVRLVDPLGAVREDARVSAQNDTIEVFPPELATGTHTLSYRITSADGHPVGGTLTFSIGKPSGPAAVGSSDPWRMTAIWLVRTIFSTALLFGTAAVFFLSRAGTPTPAARLRLNALLAVSLLAAGASIGLQGLDMLDEPAHGLFGTGSWRAGAASPYGLSMMFGMGAATAAILALSQATARRAGVFAWLAFAGIGLSAAASGHASAANPQALMRPAVFAHVACVALMLGPLLALTGLATTGRAELGVALRRFARPALVGAVGLILSGVALAIVQVESFGGLVATNYGWILLAKLALVGGIAAVFVVSRMAVAPKAPSSRARALQFELALVIGVLALTAGWRLTPPPRSIAPAARSLHIHTDKLMAMVNFTPGRAGANLVRVELMTGDFGPLESKEATLSLAPQNGAIEAVTRVLRRASDGSWIVEDFNIPFADEWLVRLDVLITDFDAVAITETFAIER